MVNIDKLLRKKGWTGEELGRLAIANLMLGYKKTLESNNPNEELPISRADFNKMIRTLKDPTEGRRYNDYIAMHDWVIRTMQVAIAQEQQAQLQLNVFSCIISNAITAEDIYRYIESLPLIMTEKQYQDTVERRTREIIKPDSGKEPNVFLLIFGVIYHYLKLLKASPKKKNPLRALKRKLQKDLVTDKYILDHYNIVMEQGYYTLEDGTRSDRLTPAEWRDLVNPLIGEYFSKVELGDSKEAEFIKNQILQRKAITDASFMFYEGVTEEEAQRLTAEKGIREGIYKKCEWHYYEQPPKDLNKWEILEKGDLLEYYLNDDEEVTVERAKAFIAEYPDVTKSILEDIATKYPSLKYVEEIPVEEWLTEKDNLKWETLYKLDFYDFKNTYTGYNAIFNGNKRAIFNGVAILKPSEFSSNIDKNTGYYVEPDIRKSLADISLEGFFPEYESYTNNVERIEDARQTFTASMYYIRAFNVCLDLIASMFDVEEVKIAKTHTDFIESKVKAINNSILVLYKRIYNTDYGKDTELKEKKLAVLKDILYPIQLEKSTVPKKRIENTKAAMKDFRAFREDSLNPSYLLCLYDPDSIEEEKGEDNDNVISFEIGEGLEEEREGE